MDGRGESRDGRSRGRRRARRRRRQPHEPRRAELHARIARGARARPSDRVGGDGGRAPSRRGDREPQPRPHLRRARIDLGVVGVRPRAGARAAAGASLRLRPHLRAQHAACGEGVARRSRGGRGGSRGGDVRARLRQARRGGASSGTRSATGRSRGGPAATTFSTGETSRGSPSGRARAGISRGFASR